jgi:hypothetical protein
MTPRTILFTVCLIASVLCLAAGYAITGQWPGIVAAIITCPAWLLSRKYRASWLPFICLLLCVCLAVAGMLSGASSLFMICSSGFSLAVWDLVLLNHALGNKPSEEQTRQYENEHVQSLAPAVTAGLLAGFLGHLFIFQIPFTLVVILIAVILFGLDRAWAYIRKDQL